MLRADAVESEAIRACLPCPTLAIRAFRSRRLAGIAFATRFPAGGSEALEGCVAPSGPPGPVLARPFREGPRQSRAEARGSLVGILRDFACI